MLILNNTRAKKYFFSQRSIIEAHDTAKYNGHVGDNGDNVGGGDHGDANDDDDDDR